MYVIYNQVNVLALFENYHIVLNCTTHFVHSPLNSFYLVSILCAIANNTEIIIFAIDCLNQSHVQLCTTSNCFVLYAEGNTISLK